ncbi:MAG: phosphotransferase [Pseudomonadota bacterium]
MANPSLDHAAVAPFLSQAGLADAKIAFLASDCSARTYYRLTPATGGGTKVLMHCQDAVTRGEMPAFLKIANDMTANGLNAPHILATDLDAGYMILNDLGDTRVSVQLEKTPEREAELYTLATDVLIRFAQLPPVAYQDLPDFRQGPFVKGHRRIMDWYVPSILKRQVTDAEIATYMQAFQSLWDALPPLPNGFVHGDFHLDNLMFLEGENGVKRAGVLDFQDASQGPPVYDLVNLLCNVRCDIPGDIFAACHARYVQAFPDTDRVAMEATFRLYAVMFHLRVIGQFIKLALRAGREQIIEHLPRINRYLQQELAHPQFAGMNQFFKDLGIHWDKTVTEADLPSLEQYIRKDAI